MIHPTADVDPRAQIGDGTKIWHHAQVRENAQIGRNCILGKGVFVDFGVRIGDNCKLQNYALIYHGAELEDGVFMGPHASLLNDKLPRAITPDGILKTDADWQTGRVLVRRGASIGAGALVVPDVTIGEFALVGAGAVVTRDVPSFALALGNPARLVGHVCMCGRKLTEYPENDTNEWKCEYDGLLYRLRLDGGMERVSANSSAAPSDANANATGDI
jgi:acetyltransferase-like isoleucine patch superfamily enzyme